MICATCGSDPCVNPGFCKACRSADRQARGKLRPRAEARLPTPQVTIEAVMYAVRSRGLAALKEPATVERLSRCDVAAMAEIERRIANLRKD
jgi:hypothetical protein